MQTLTTSILSRHKPSKVLKILTMPTHEGHASIMAKTGHEFHMITAPGHKPWNFHTRPLPHNHFVITLDRIENFHPIEQYDIVLSQNRLANYHILKPIAARYNIPFVAIDHTEPPPGMVGEYLHRLEAMRGNPNVFITEFNKQSWKGYPADPVIPHGIDTSLFRGYHGTEPRGLSVVNLFPQRDMFCGWTLWKDITSTIPVKLVGENPGLSESISDVSKLIAELCSARFFLNTSQWSPVPLSMIEAMACGCPVVTTAKQEIPNIIRNGENGFMSNDPEELKGYCKQLLDDKDLATRLGAAGRQTVIERFGIDRFVANWNRVLYKAIEDHR